MAEISESLEDALERRRRKPISSRINDECGKETFINRLEKLTTLLRWTRVIKNTRSEAISVNLIKRWGRGNIHACLQMWRKETEEKKQHAQWAPADVVMTRYARKKQRRHRSNSESSSEDEDLLSPQSPQGVVGNDGEQPLVYTHRLYLSLAHTHTHTHTHTHIYI